MAILAAEPEIEASLRQILAAPPFSSPSLDSQLLERLAEWYRSHVRDLYLQEPVLFWISVVGLTFIAILLVWHLSRSARAVWRALKRGPTAAGVIALTSKGLRLDGARASLAGGDHRACVELCWRALIDAFAEPTEVTETPRGQARRLAGRLGLQGGAAVYQLLAFHEQACYAGVPTTDVMATAALAAAVLVDTGASDG